MVRVTTIWDKIEELVDEEKVIVQKKVFRVAGDERYARTTDVIFSNLTQTSRNNYGYIATAEVDVLRDYGDSTITIHDADTVLSVINWSSVGSAQTIELPRLSWNVTHKLWVSYDGNSQCLKSKSDVIECFQTNPDIVDTTLSNNSNRTHYTADEDVTASIKLAKSGGTASLNNREIRIFVNDVDYGAVNTNSSGVATLNLGHLSNGVKAISAYFDGEDALGDSSITYNIYVGYLITIEEYPQTFIKNGYNTVKVSVKDYGYNPINHIRVHFIDDVQYTDDNGVATLHPSNVTNNYDYYAYLTQIGNYTSETIRVHSAVPTSIELTARDEYTGLNRANPITAIVSGSNIQANIPITLKASTLPMGEDIDFGGTYFTDSTGKIEVNYFGGGYGAVRIDAEVGYEITGSGVSTITSFNDVDVYINRPTISINPNWTVEGQSPIKLNNGYKIMPSITPTSSYTFLIFDQATFFGVNDYCTLKFDIVEVKNPSNFALIFGSYNDKQVYGEGRSINKLQKGSTVYMNKVGTTTTIIHEYDDSNGHHEDVVCTFEWNDGYALLGMVNSTEGSYVTINNIMLRKD